MNGINDINMDGTVDIVVTDTDTSGNPFVRVINASTGALTGYLIPGICLDVQRLDLTQPGTKRDLIVFNPATGAHSIWRFNAGTYTPFQLSDDGTFSANVVVVRQSYPQGMSLTDDPRGLSGSGQFQATITRLNNTRAFVGFSPASCPSGLKTWTVSAGTSPNVNKSLDFNPRPGDIVNVMPVNDLANYVWMINLESSCGTVSNILRSYTQSGTTLLISGDLSNLSDTEPPTFPNGCPPTLNVAAPIQCPYAASTVVTYTNPVATDNNPGVTVSCNPPSGSTFPVGATTVTCTATDTSNNTATCSFTVKAFSACLADDSNPGNVVLFNAVTGEYRFCGGGVTIASGSGTLTVNGCDVTIDHQKGSRFVHISASGSGGSGTAYVQYSGVTKYSITDTTLVGDTCYCP